MFGLRLGLTLLVIWVCFCFVRLLQCRFWVFGCGWAVAVVLGLVVAGFLSA